MAIQSTSVGKGAWTIEDDLAVHQMREQEWVFQPVLRELHRFAAIFDMQFKLLCPKPVLKITKLRSRVVKVTVSHNDLGLANEIALDVSHIAKGLIREEGWRDVLKSLLIGMIQLWEFSNHRKTTYRGYTNRFLDKARECGLVAEKRGKTIVLLPTSVFLGVLTEHNAVSPQIEGLKLSAVKKAKTKLRLWVCACNPPLRARIAVPDPNLKCMKCGEILRNIERNKSAKKT